MTMLLCAGRFAVNRFGLKIIIRGGNGEEMVASKSATGLRYVVARSFFWFRQPRIASTVTLFIFKQRRSRRFFMAHTLLFIFQDCDFLSISR